MITNEDMNYKFDHEYINAESDIIYDQIRDDIMLGLRCKSCFNYFCKCKCKIFMTKRKDK